MHYLALQKSFPKEKDSLIMLASENNLLLFQGQSARKMQRLNWIKY